MMSEVCFKIVWTEIADKANQDWKILVILGHLWVNSLFRGTFDNFCSKILPTSLKRQTTRNDSWQWPSVGCQTF